VSEGRLKKATSTALEKFNTSLNFCFITVVLLSLYEFGLPFSDLIMPSYKFALKIFLSVDGYFEVSKEIDLKIRKIEKEMKSLQSKIAKEKQFKYKVELNKKLLSLKKELEELKSE